MGQRVANLAQGAKEAVSNPKQKAATLGSHAVRLGLAVGGVVAEAHGIPSGFARAGEAVGEEIHDTVKSHREHNKIVEEAAQKAAEHLAGTPVAPRSQLKDRPITVKPGKQVTQNVTHQNVQHHYHGPVHVASAPTTPAQQSLERAKQWQDRAKKSSGVTTDNKKDDSQSPAQAPNALADAANLIRSGHLMRSEQFGGSLNGATG